MAARPAPSARATDAPCAEAIPRSAVMAGAEGQGRERSVRTARAAGIARWTTPPIPSLVRSCSCSCHGPRTQTNTEHLTRSASLDSSSSRPCGRVACSFSILETLPVHITVGQSTRCQRRSHFSNHGATDHTVSGDCRGSAWLPPAGEARIGRASTGFWGTRPETRPGPQHSHGPWQCYCLHAWGLGRPGRRRRRNE